MNGAEPRDIGKVIDQMLLLVPTWEKGLKENLSWLKEHSAYQPPEAMRDCWARASLCLERAIPKPHLPWHWDVLSVFMVKPVEDLQKMFK